MNARLSSLSTCVAALSLCIGCRPPGKPTSADIELKPEEVRDFAVLYRLNCAGCHGQDGKGNTALALANPVYLAIASDDTIRSTLAISSLSSQNDVRYRSDRQACTPLNVLRPPA